MQTRLSFFIVPIWVLSIVGAIVIAALAAGWVGWLPFVVAGAVGLLGGILAGIWNARRIKRDDPDWPRNRRHVPVDPVQ